MKSFIDLSPPEKTQLGLLIIRDCDLLALKSRQGMVDSLRA
jgi:hypothetical protein